MKLLNINTILSDLTHTVEEMEDCQLKADIESHIHDLQTSVSQMQDVYRKLDKVKDDLYDLVD